MDLTALLQETCAALGSSPKHNLCVELLPGSTERCAVPPGVAAPLVLIVTEAITNAIKYAHPTGVPGKVVVSCQQDLKSAIAIQVTDDGVGLPENFDAASDGNTGFSLMRASSERLGATLAFKSTSLGLEVSLSVPRAASLAGNGAVLTNGGLGNGYGKALELLDAMPAAVYMTDAVGRITYYNEAASALWGCQPELGKSEFCGSWKLFWPDGRALPHADCPMAMTLKQQRPIRGVEAVAERPDGTRVPFMPYPTPLFDASGALTGAVNMLVDISERKRAEATLARRRDEQSALYRLTDRLFRAGSLRDVYGAALDAIELALGCERSSLLLVDQTGVMRFVSSRGLSEGYRQAVEGHSPWRHDDKDPQPICIENIEEANIDDALKETVRGEGIGALAFIPLTAKGELIGKL